MKQFFDINKNFSIEIYDIMALITVLNTVFIIAGFWWAPILGLTNCGIVVIMNMKTQAHINSYITQLALIALNLFFLK